MRKKLIAQAVQQKAVPEKTGTLPSKNGFERGIKGKVYNRTLFLVCFYN